MSSIRRRANGKLFFDFRFLGVRCREYTDLGDTVRNRRLLEKALKRIEEQIAAGTFDYAATFPNSKRAQQFPRPQEGQGRNEGQPADQESAQSGRSDAPQLKDFAETWFSENEVLWKHSYREKQRDLLDRYLIPQFGEKVVSDIRKPEILAFRAQLAKDAPGRKNSLSASRINQILNLLKQVLDEAADRFDFNTPFQRIKPLRNTRSEVDPFSLEEVQSFLDELPEPWRPYFTVRFFTGMRTSEIDGLKWKYVDFDREEIQVREVRVWGETDVPKTDGSMRSIQMSGVVKQALEEQRRNAHPRSEYVFSTRHGYPLAYRNVNNRVWYPTLQKAGLRKRNPYQTRHTAATLWLAAGESPEWIARQMGHTTTKMLFTVYSRYVPNLTRRDGSAMERLLRSTIGAAAVPGQQREEVE